jgi:LDH2 family malate/lactate/ureidoglycolate dehydrogenase
VAEILLEGDLLGHTTHGMALLAAYLQELQDGRMEKTGEPVVLAAHGSTLTWDGRFLPGPWLVREAIRAAQAGLAESPVSTVVIRRSHHIGCLQAYLKPVTDAGIMILLSCSDPACRLVAPQGGAAPRLSPNPMAAGIPTSGAPILMDISMSTTAHAVCKRWIAAGQRAPGPWLVDRNGNATDDPNVVSEGQGGALLPLGGMDLGHKGFALALLVEALTSALAGHGRADAESRWGCSVFLQLIAPAGFGGRDEFLRETTYAAQSCRETPVGPGKPPVRLPGESAQTRRARQLAEGVELHPGIMPGLAPWAEKLGVSVPKRI